MVRWYFILDYFFRWQEIDEEISKYPEFHTNDFTVISLPGIKNVKLPLNNNGVPEVHRYFSTDCFHISQLGNAQCKYNFVYYFIQNFGSNKKFIQ